MSATEPHRPSPKRIRVRRKINRTYVCYLCGKVFGQRFCLKRHFRIHSGIRPANCEICGLSFIQAGNKNKHLKTHFDLRYSQKTLEKCIHSKLYKIKLIQGTHRFRCKLCGYTCSFPEAAEFHATSH